MNFFELFIVAVSLALDALAVSVSNGLMLKKATAKHAVIFGLYFGFFQFMMPVIGYFGGTWFSHYIEMFDHWIAFGLLSIIGGKMLWDTFVNDDSHDESNNKDNDDERKIMSPKNLIMLAVATSIDALAVGVSFALTDSGNIWFSAGVIGVVAFVLSFLGVIAGKKIGEKFQTYATRIGGLVLIAIGLKILIQDLFF